MKKKLLSLICSLFISIFMFTGCSSASDKSITDTSPEKALNELRQAIVARDSSKVHTLTDLDAFLADTYDVSSKETALLIGRLHERYPEDPFFWHDTEFMLNYSKEHREISLLFTHKILDYFFSKETPATDYDDNPESWLSGELSKLHKACTASVLEIQQSDKGHATAVLKLIGDGTPYGNLTDGIVLKLGMDKQRDGNWKFTSVENIPELIIPVADKAEMFWTLQGWQ